MSTARGDTGRRRPQRFQNREAFHHNKNSRKTKSILALPIDGLCRHCRDIVAWRKQFRKYKPLTVAKRCVGCGERTVKKAYHELCDACAQRDGLCAKCRQPEAILPPDQTTAEQRAAETRAQQAQLESMTERQRRAFLRALERGDGGGGDSGDEAGSADDAAPPAARRDAGPRWSVRGAPIDNGEDEEDGEEGAASGDEESAASSDMASEAASAMRAQLAL